MGTSSDVDAIAMLKRFSFRGGTGSISLQQFPKIRDAREPDLSFAGKNPGGDTVAYSIKALGKYR